MKRAILFLVVLVFTACTNQNNLHVENQEFELKKVNTFDRCANLSYVSDIQDEVYGKLFIEYIDLDLSCTWTGFQRGYFEDLFKTTLKLKSMKAIERFDYKNYEFSTYIIDDTYYMNLIYKFGVKDDTFIIDYSGKYFDKLIKEFNPNYKNISLNKIRFDSNYNNSLVNMNKLNAYFTKDSDRLEYNNK